MLGCAWEGGGGEATLNCEPVQTSLKRQGLTRVTTIACPVQLYGAECGVVKSLHSVTGLVTGVSAATIDVTNVGLQVDGYYSGGYAVWANDAGNNDYRTIMSHVGDSLELIAPMHGLEVADTVEIFPGCDRTWDTCVNKYANGLNYRGLKYLPTDVNPLAGGKVF